MGSRKANSARRHIAMHPPCACSAPWAEIDRPVASVTIRRPRQVWLTIVLAGVLPAFWPDLAKGDTPDEYFGIRVVDEQTGRGVPLVELETVNHLCWVTDSGGWVAIHEPELMGQTVYFFIRSHGYVFPQDGFRFAGVALPVRAGHRVTVQIKRVNVAERLYRMTGEGIYRDSALLGETTPLAKPPGQGLVAGQDSAFAEPYRGKIYWFWGDTSRLRYPLGHFWMAGAISELPTRGGLDPSQGVDLTYFVDADGFSRPVARLGVDKGMIWADGFLTLHDGSGRERLVCHYAHMASLDNMLAHGLAAFDDDRQEFQRLTELDLKLRHLFPGQAHPIRYRVENAEFLYFGEVFPQVRVKATWKDYLDPNSYEALTCVADASTADDIQTLRDAGGNMVYEWRNNAVPIDAAMEKKLIAAGQLRADEARFLPIDVASGEPVLLHRGTVRWNDYRQRWVMIACQSNGTSNLGEIWYSEADEPTGPWRRAVKVVTHNRYSFYNPVHHSIFDQDGGRTIYFEGTYTQAFSGNPSATPRYDYNQIMYRLDLMDPRLRTAQ